jgi:predicted metal-binding protein
VIANGQLNPLKGSMPLKDTAPELHLFVCTNQRESGRESCANCDTQTLRDTLKKVCKTEFPATKIRINNAGCLGFCEKGGVAVLYPEGKWFFNLKSGDSEEILKALRTNLAQKETSSGKDPV